MVETKRIIRPLISVLIIGATVLGLYNVYGDNTEVVAMARETACEDAPSCEATMRSQGRHAFAQTFTFHTNVPDRSTVEVSCTRSLYLLGSYSCERK